MLSQILTLKVAKQHASAAHESVQKWAQTAGKRLDGCEEVHIAQGVGDPSRIAVLIRFKDRAALDRFSADPESRAMFEKAKQFVEGKLDYFEADLSRHDLT
jgi:quinol monooxygenase YgiN